MIHGLKALAVAMLLALAGCVATGHSFNSAALGDLTPGQTTMAQAVYMLNAPPDKIYPQSDGTTMALWRVHATWLVDTVYVTLEAMLLFGPDGRLVRLVDGTNLPLSSGAQQKLSGGVAPPAPPAPEVQPGPPQAQPVSTGGNGATMSASPNLGSSVAGPPPGMENLQTYTVPVPAAPAAAQ
jgi:methyl-accepting chemotaxis protein-1 (serine sensor receptor)